MMEVSSDKDPVKNLLRKFHGARIKINLTINYKQKGFFEKRSLFALRMLCLEFKNFDKYFCGGGGDEQLPYFC